MFLSMVVLIKPRSNSVVSFSQLSLTEKYSEKTINNKASVAELKGIGLKPLRKAS